jgi:hypothetical protein
VLVPPASEKPAHRTEEQHREETGGQSQAKLRSAVREVEDKE